MKIHIPFFFLLFLGFNAFPSFSQSSYFSVKESQKFTDNKRETNVLAVHTNDKDQTIVAREARRELIFEVFNKNAKNIFDKTIKLATYESFNGEIFYDDELKVFTVHKVNLRTRVIYAHILNIETKRYRKVELFTTTVERGQQLFLAGLKRQTYFALSPDEKLLAIATDNISKNQNSYLIHVLDAKSLSLIYKKKYYEDEQKRFNLSSLAIENDGNVYSLGKEYQNGRAEKKLGGNANYEFVLCKVNDSGKKVLNLRLNGDVHMRTMKIANEEGEFRLIGFYSEKNVRRIKGVGMVIIDPVELEIESQKEFPLPLEVFEDLYGYRKADRKSDKELSNFYLDHVLEDDFGNIYMLAEEFYVTQSYVSDGNGSGYYTYQEHYDDILILKFDAAGNLAWGRSIFKRSGGPS